MKRRCCALAGLWLILCLFLSFSPAHAEDNRDTARTIRVGIVDAMDIKNDFSHHMLQQYLHNYLDEVSKQNHWQYDFVIGSLEDCLHWLNSGELDFIAPIQENPATDEGMVFSSGSFCYSLLSVYGLQDDPRNGSVHAGAINGSTVGILDNEENIRAFRYHLAENQWHVNIRRFRDPRQMVAALRNGELNAVVDDGTHMTEAEQRILTFAVIPAQFMTTEKNRALCDMLTSAVLTSETLNPSFETELEAEYLDKALQNLIRHTEAEWKYIETSPVLRVALLPNIRPLFDVGGPNLELSHGIYMDLLKMVSTISGMRFELKQAPSEEALRKMLEDGEADLAFAVYSDQKSPLDTYFTNDFRKEEFSVVRKRREPENADSKGVVALAQTFPGAQYYLQQHYHWRVHTYATVTECFDAVEREECEAALVPAPYIQRNSSMALRPSLVVADDETLRIPISMEISPHQPRILQRVLNTTLLRLNREQVARLVRENSAPEFSLGYILHQYPLQTAIVLCFFLGGGAVTAFVFYRNSLQRKQNLVLQQKNQELRVALENVESMRVSRDGYKMKSRTDMLTGLYNKKATEHICQQQLATLAEDRLAALFILDLDHFKEANDTYGHQCGDDILRNFAESLRNIFRTNDCLGRFGGDEFTVFLCDLPNEKIISTKAVQILEAARNLRMEGKDIHITSSVGIAIAPKHGMEYEELFHVADQALYKVKTEGRDGFSIGSGEVMKHAEHTAV